MGLSVPFHRPTALGSEWRHVCDAIASGALAGDGPFGRRCEAHLSGPLGLGPSLLTTSGTHALEVAAYLLDLAPGDEVIMPSFTFPSTATAFVSRGAVPVFVDVRPDTMNLDEARLEAAVTARTRAVVVVHYGGVAAQMDDIIELAAARGLAVVEDAAHAIGATYFGRPLGAIGDLGAFSFHATKNVTSGGEGGLLTVRDGELFERAKVIREKGTNRSAFVDGRVSKYEWVDHGSSYVMSELGAAFLWPQLQALEDITERRRSIAAAYRAALSDAAAAGRVELQATPAGVSSADHLFYVKLRSPEERAEFVAGMRARGVGVASHYEPLHLSPAGRKFGRVGGGELTHTGGAHRLARLPLYYNLSPAEVERVIGAALECLG